MYWPAYLSATQPPSAIPWNQASIINYYGELERAQVLGPGLKVQGALADLVAALDSDRHNLHRN